MCSIWCGGYRGVVAFFYAHRDCRSLMSKCDCNWCKWAAQQGLQEGKGAVDTRPCDPESDVKVCREHAVVSGRHTKGPFGYHERVMGCGKGSTVRGGCPRCEVEAKYADAAKTVRNLMRKAGLDDLSSDTVHAACMRAVDKVMREFDPSLGVKFSTYLYSQVRCAIHNTTREPACKVERHSDIDFLDIPFETVDPYSGDECERIDVAEELAYQLGRVAADLGEDSVSLLLMRHGAHPFDKEHTFAEIGRALNRSESWARERYNQILQACHGRNGGHRYDK